MSGETQFYLGKRYVLKIITDAEQLPNVKLSRGKLNVTIKYDISKDTAPDSHESRLVKIKPLIDKWYQHKAKAIFHERLAELLPKDHLGNRHSFFSCDGNEKAMGKLLN